MEIMVTDHSGGLPVEVVRSECKLRSVRVIPDSAGVVVPVFDLPASSSIAATLWLTTGLGQKASLATPTSSAACPTRKSALPASS